MSNGLSPDKHFELAVDIGVQGLKAALLVNGGAAAAFIALTGRVAEAPDYSAAIVWFGVAALLTIVAFAFAYYSQIAYANSVLHADQNETAEKKKQHTRHRNLSVLIGILVAGMVICSAVGMFTAYQATQT